jgi:D-alanyl-D-alanine carboxypeptidase
MPPRCRARRTILAITLLSISCRGTASTGTRGGTGSGSADQAALAARIDSLVVAFRADERIPGLSVAVVRGADTLLYKGYGLANVEDSVPATTATVYRIGSITKQFTASGILRLVEQGKIQLDAPLSAYLPNFPEPGRRATIRQLLTHTSGIPSYTDLSSFPDKRRTDLTDDQLLALVDRRPLDFPPGTRWHYDNSGYYILGVILQHLTGTPYGTYIEQTIAKPLGLNDTRYCATAPLIPRRADGYSLDSNTVINADWLSMNLPGAAGALCSTVGDLLKWQRALTNGQVVNPATYRQMTTPAVLADGKSTRYGFALSAYALHGHPTVEHSGGINGFSSQLSYFPADSLSVVVLLNTDAASSSVLARQIAELVLGAPDAGSANLPVDTADRRRDVGTYTAAGDHLQIEDHDGHLVMAGRHVRALRYQGNNRFVPADDHDLELVFHISANRATGVTITSPDGATREFARAP